MVGGLEYFPRCAPAGISIICSAAGQVSSNHVPVVFIVPSRVLHKNMTPYSVRQWHGTNPTSPPVVRGRTIFFCGAQPGTPFGPPSSLARTPCNPLPPMKQPSLPMGVSPTQSGQEICRKFNYASCNHAECSFAHKCWFTGCLGDHPGKSCPRAPAAPG